MTSQVSGLRPEIGAMTPTDWFGLVILITLTVLVAGVYVYVFSPSRKAELNKLGSIPFNDDPSIDKE